MKNESPCYLCDFVENGRVAAANDLLLKDLGYERDEMVGVLKLEDLLTPGSKIFFLMHFYPMIKLQGSAEEVFLSLKKKDGGELPVLLNAIADRSGKQLIIRTAGLAISKRNKFEKALIEAKAAAENALLENKGLLMMKSQLQKNEALLEKKLRLEKRISREQLEINKVLAHDLQEPFRKISMQAHLLLERYADINESVPLKIIELVENTRELLNAIQRYQLLELRLDEREEMDLRALIRSAADKSGMDGTPIDLDKITVDKVYGHPHYLEKVFEELFSNTKKFRSPDRPLEMKISATTNTRNLYVENIGHYAYGTFLDLRFEDNGIGFDQVYAEKAFTLMEKLVKNPGYGLGLAFCRKVIALHDGSITVRTSPDAGARFTILIPLKEAAKKQLN